MTKKPGREKGVSAKAGEASKKRSGRKEKRISFEEAKEQYRLELPDFRYIGLPAMKRPSERRYTKKELLEVVARRDAFRKTAGEERQALTAANTVKRQQEKKAWQKECKEIVAGWDKSKLKKLKHSSSSTLPLDVWTKVLEALCNDVELEGVRGPSVVARDIINAALVSKEVYAASLPALQRLSSFCKPIKESLSVLPSARRCPWTEEDAVWDQFVSEPTTISAFGHCGPCRILGLSASQPKATMIVEVLRELHMVRPSPAPARLVIAVAMERHEKPCDLVEMCAELTELDHHKSYKDSQDYGFYAYYNADCSAFRLRQDCMKHGITSLKCLEAASSEAAANNEADLLLGLGHEEDLDDGEDESDED